jgi:hypothetical protein
VTEPNEQTPLTENETDSATETSCSTWGNQKAEEAQKSKSNTPSLPFIKSDVMPCCTQFMFVVMDRVIHNVYKSREYQQIYAHHEVIITDDQDILVLL